jgi:uncharacterized membrane protein YoaK (UPF0700 family)
MPIRTTDPAATHSWANPSSDAATSPRWEARLPTLLSVIAGMVDLIGFLTLGNIFTAHITGNLVVAAAVLVRGGPLNPAQALAIPVFMLAVAATWWVAKTSGMRGPRLARLLLLIQFLLLAGVLIFTVVTGAAANPRGVTAAVAAMIAVSAMACQYALLRLATPRAPSTAVMTGNLTYAVLSLMDATSRDQPLIDNAGERLRRTVPLLIGFFGGCVVAAAAVAFLGSWAWAFPAALAGIAVALE